MTSLSKSYKVAFDYSYSARQTSISDDNSLLPIKTKVEVFYTAPNAIDFNSVASMFYDILVNALSSSPIFVKSTDAALPYLLSPKNGMSIQELISFARTQLANNLDFYVIGTETPSNTSASGIVVAVTGADPILENVAEWFFHLIDEDESLLTFSIDVTAIRVTYDSGAHVVVSANDTLGQQLSLL